MHDVVVTGGTKGIGAYISKFFKGQGYNVLALYHSDDENADEFQRETGVYVLPRDITNQQHIDEIDRYFKVYGYPKILVNCAGYNDDAFFHKMAHKQWDGVLDTILFGTANMTRICLPAMREMGYGRIINISSVVPYIGVMGTVNYSTAKAGLEGFTRSLAKEVATKGITVNTLALGYFDTGIIRNVEKYLDQIIDRVPMKRLGDENDLRKALIFLLTSPFYTGQVLHLNGGLY